ncbi:hypothetical protein AGMMS49938_03310 [Fibrobacterales bacterium]|nr:hypothetical protein AGMMS49938_03310 [Fibrobacterales bacterium]
MNRNSILNLTDTELLKLCSVSSYKGSGNGGQHRNKTMTGVRLCIAGIEIKACDDRSAHINKLSALKKLRLKIALQIREKPSAKIPFLFPSANGHISQDNKLYPQFIADILDRITDSKATKATDFLTETAKIWGISKSALNKIITADKRVLQSIKETSKNSLCNTIPQI